MTDILVDSNFILDVLTEDPQWFDWSAQTIANYADQGDLVINPIIYAGHCPYLIQGVHSYERDRPTSTNTNPPHQDLQNSRINRIEKKN